MQPELLYAEFYRHFYKDKPAADYLNNVNNDLKQRLDTIRAVSSTVTEFKDPIFIGVAPTYAFNASARNTGSGFLVLVHETLMHFVLQLSILMAGLVNAEAQGAKLQPVWNLSEAKKFFFELINSFLIDQKFEIPLRIGLKGGREHFIHFLFASTLDFIIAHELGHIVEGHCSKESKALKIPSDFDSFYSQSWAYSWQQELKADLFAMSIIKELYRDKVSDESTYFGAIIFFELAATINDALVKTGRLDSTDAIRTHPPSRARRSIVISETHPDAQLAILPRVNELVDLITKLRRR